MPGRSRPWQLRADVLRLGPNVPESVTRDRQEFHKWIAKRIVGPVHAEGNARATKYLPADQIRSHPYLLHQIIDLEPLPDERTITIIDCSLNHYQIMSENVLQSLAICALELARTADQVCVIMLASFPHNYHSPFWTAFEDMESSGGSVVVVNNDGVPRLFGRAHRRAQLGDEYRSRLRKISGTPQQEFEDKIIRRMGHFRINEKYCSRFFFDGSRAVSELSDLLIAEIRNVVARGKMSRTELLVPADANDWMKEAIGVVANRLSMRCSTFLGAAPAENRIEKGITYLFVSDFINSNESYRELIADTRTAGYELHEYAIAAFVAREFHNYDDKHPSMRPVKRVSTGLIPRSECVQCKLALSFTDKYQDNLIGLRSYDAWEILSTVDWEPESYGPTESAKVRSLPSFTQIVAKYGDYLAYKLEQVLREVAPKEVAIACPEEPAVNDLVKRMQPWVDGRIAAVLLPRKPLLEIDDESLATVKNFGRETEWSRQLSHLSDRKVSVVMIDEFNASNTTAKQMMRVLQAYQLYPRAYVPIFNFAMTNELDGVRVEALYEFPNPREAWS